MKTKLLPELPVSLSDLLAMIEREYVEEALAKSDGNQTEAAKLLGMGRTTLVEKMRRRASGVRRNTTYAYQTAAATK
jgi:sigma-54 specific flagellar transcriptional regulator A